MVKCLFQVKCVEVFKDFYETRTKHRKLTWIYSLGTCNISGKFEPKTIELIVSTYQVFPSRDPSSSFMVNIVTLKYLRLCTHASGLKIVCFTGCCSVAIQHC